MVATSLYNIESSYFLSLRIMNLDFHTNIHFGFAKKSPGVWMTQPYGLATLETAGGQLMTSMIHGQGFELFLRFLLKLQVCGMKLSTTQCF